MSAGSRPNAASARRRSRSPPRRRAAPAPTAAATGRSIWRLNRETGRPYTVIPAKAGIPLLLLPKQNKRDPRFRGGDGTEALVTLLPTPGIVPSERQPAVL